MNPPKMPIHIGDYKRDTGHLRAAQHGAYLMLLFHHWSTGSLPADDDQLAAIACMTRAEWAKSKPILEKFFSQEWRHGRIEEDLEKARASYEKRAKAGEKGGKAKADGKQQSSSNAKAGPQLPYTLDQTVKEDTADAVQPTAQSDNRYAFESGIIRLSEKDFSKWKANFIHLDVGAELIGMTEWAQQQGPDRWFHAVVGLLTKRNREAKKASGKEQTTPFKWNGIEGVI